METKRVEVGGRTYVLNKIPAFQAQKIAFTCMNALKTRDFAAIPDDVMLKVCSYIGAVNASGNEIRLSSEELISVNVRDSGDLMLLELNELEYNFGFFFDGSLLKEIDAVVKRFSQGESEKADAAPTDTLKA